MTVFDIEVAKRFKDIDPYNHVSNAIYPDLIMEARIRMYRQMGLDERSAGEQVVVNQEVTYREPIEYGLDPLRIETWVSHVGRTSYSVNFRIHDGPRIAADARTVMVCFDISSGKSRSIPEEFKKILERHLHTH